MRELPAAFQQFAVDHPDVYRAYEDLAKAAQESGPLDLRTRHLIKLAIAVGARLEGAVHSHVWQAQGDGISEAELDQVVLLSLTTIGLPSRLAYRLWWQPGRG